jgi:hypothetical protein
LAYYYRYSIFDKILYYTGYFINVIGNRLIAESGDSKSKKFLFERISLAIQRGNAASIRGTFPDSAIFFRNFCIVNQKCYVIMLGINTIFIFCISRAIMILTKLKKVNVDFF